jgi:hypothetical protein
MLGSADFRSPRIKPNMPTGIWETAWTSAGADLGITIDPILIVREQSGARFSSMGPLPRHPWSAFKQGKF